MYFIVLLNLFLYRLLSLFLFFLLIKSSPSKLSSPKCCYILLITVRISSTYHTVSMFLVVCSRILIFSHEWIYKHYRPFFYHCSSLMRALPNLYCNFISTWHDIVRHNEFLLFFYTDYFHFSQLFKWYSHSDIWLSVLQIGLQ